MQIKRIRALLNEHENTALDFKRDQYRLTNDEEKSELLKDLLAFANTPRTSDAYIIIGIKEEPTPPHTVTGITDHAFDHHLQQLVNNKLNRPINFSYETQEVDGKTIGIITIGRRQTPPHHLTKDFGKLKKDFVYVRRGSSTAVATPDEITRLQPRTRSRYAARAAHTVRTLALNVMYRHDEFISARGGRGIPGFAYTPPERTSISLGEYVRLDAKLLITPGKPLVIVSALSTATITTAEKNTITIDNLTFDSNVETIDITTARVVHIKGESRVRGDVLAGSRAEGLHLTMNLANASGGTLQYNDHLNWQEANDAFAASRDNEQHPSDANGFTC